ncbi:riboflavin kinase/FMN adenylyltransferase [Chthonomonas calidirosea]|uniref:Riboflavin biosynthesis protein n=1 Tax=Chthonomonas calidirosea (strain DSM 23976 / ICMP 18418 / T49) TaxID=1303518 RepID=S0EVY2_CHTCT|nr:bifunctional riboflavin kinase/FAD synthetase [Chthonomonas calidirosea]CCW35977.1 FMN adenylyltransferase/riboflavin kinase [Chthonomonas calidirosea T49]CEK18690.1 riboflavin kinase/FMN adenylyltransferase [Chthonomonas calidirosea]
MILYEGLHKIPAPFSATTVAIGTFDGVHVGHQAIIRTAVENAHTHGRPALVFTFDRHPAELLRPTEAPPYITTPNQRNRLIEQLGVDILVIAHFDTALANLSHEEFVDRILVGLCGAKAIVEGRDFCFGKGRAGNLAYLLGVQARYGFEVHAVDPVIVNGVPASSTRARECLRSGDIAEAEAVLGHPFWLEGRVVQGQRLGRKLGYPTANLEPTYRQVVPADGIYAVWVSQDGGLWPGVCSIGERPTIEGAGRAIEVYLFDFEGDLYDRILEVRFVQRLRGEERFDSLEALQSQMACDVAAARQVLMGMPNPSSAS